MLAQRVVPPQRRRGDQRRAIAAVELQPDDPLWVVGLDGSSEAVAEVVRLLNQGPDLGLDDLCAGERRAGALLQRSRELIEEGHEVADGETQVLPDHLYVRPVRLHAHGPI